MSEAKRMSEEEFKGWRSHPWDGGGALFAEAERARSAEAALEARLAAGVEAARDAMEQLRAFRPETAVLRAYEVLQAFVEGEGR